LWVNGCRTSMRLQGCFWSSGEVQVRDDTDDRHIRCALQALEWTREAPLILDTETTGLGSDDEVVQVALTDVWGKPILYSLARPTKLIPAEATKIHGITNSHVRNVPTGGEVVRQLVEIAGNRPVCIYNAEFDVRMIRQTARAWGISIPSFRDLCVMKLFAEYVGEWNSYRRDWKWQKLSDAARRCDLGGFSAHDALGDAQMTAKLLAHLAALAPEVEGAESGLTLPTGMTVATDLSSQPRRAPQRTVTEAPRRQQREVQPSRTVQAPQTPVTQAPKRHRWEFWRLD